MIKRSLAYLLVGIVSAWGLFSCSTEKNTALSRSYHNLTSHYNVYFNGREAYKQGIFRLENSHIENYNKILMENGNYGIPSDLLHDSEIIPTSTYLFGTIPSLTYNLRF